MSDNVRYIKQSESIVESVRRIQRGEDGGREPPDNGGVEARVAKLEASAEFAQRELGEIKADIRQIKDHARTDFRLLFGAIIVTTLGLAGLMAKGFGWV